jgi:predicted alpha/beta superfamily hydrolase
MKWLLVLGLLLFGERAAAQLQSPRIEAVHSDVLNEQRDIEVFLPEEAAADPKARFETLYVLDGDWNSKLVTDTVTFMRQVGFLPPLIVVSVKHHLDAQGHDTRTRDLTPTVITNEPGSGGAPQFLKFLKEELAPYIDAHYPTNGLKSIHGHSYGGLFLFYVLLNHPEAFDGYLILDPSLWWDNHAYDALVKERLPHLQGHGKAVFMGGRDGFAGRFMGLAAIEPLFQELAPKDLHWQGLFYSGETHDSLKLKGSYDGLKFLFGGYTQDRLEITPSRGTLIKGKPLTLCRPKLSERLELRYTTDGSTPDDSSPPFKGCIVIDNDRARIRLISARGEFDREPPLHLNEGVYWRPDERKLDPRSQWLFSAFEPSEWPHLSRAHPFDTQKAAGSAELKDDGRKDFVATAERRLAVADDDYYLFYVEASSDVRLFVSGKQVLNIAAKDEHEQSIVLPLKRGTYRVRFEYQHPNQDSRAFLKAFRLPGDATEWWNGRPVLDLAGEPH